ncbi:hypothetical protein DSO57_1031186 [Entomophthora muscae]|uniref:Uncharacterized protein n=1 Tax=Entomophthora muscae TaxID=34485 RepID=A0ACC2T0X0_9FUNG|nr:hypothetical protein DSO57_1031186 [Entomophthora muscae]
MKDINKLVTDLFAKLSAVLEENKVIIKGLIEVSSMLDDIAKEMEELEQFCQKITLTSSSSQKARLVSTSSTYQKAMDVYNPQKTLEQVKKKPRILMRKLMVVSTNKEKEKTIDNQEPMEKPLQVSRKEVLVFKKFVDSKTSKKRTEALNPSTVRYNSQVNGFLIPCYFGDTFEVTHEKEILEEEVPEVTREQLAEFLNEWLANGPQSEFLAGLGLLIMGLFGSDFVVACLDQVEFPDFLNFCKVSSIVPLDAGVVGKALLVMHNLQEVLFCSWCCYFPQVGEFSN